MAVRQRSTSRPAAASRGLTLVEVVVAAAIVLLVVTAASSTIGVVNAAGARAGGRDAAEAAVASELAALRGLPFAAKGTADAVVAAVFPQADPAATTRRSFFAAAARDGCPAGTYFTVRETPAGPLTVAATFLTSTSCGWAPVDAARLQGFDARTAAVLPAAALLVRASVAWRVGMQAGVVTRATIVLDRPDGLCRLAAPTAAP